MERVLKLENYYFETIMGKIRSSKSHHWFLNLRRNVEEEQNICIASKCLPLDCLLIAREKETVITPRGKNFQVIEINITNERQVDS